MSLPRLSTSNPIRSLTRLRVKLQTSSESLREDEQDDPEWSRSSSWCYRPAVSLCVFMLVSLHRLDAALRLARGSAACRAAAWQHAEQNQNNLVSYKMLLYTTNFLCQICFGRNIIAAWTTFFPQYRKCDVLVLHRSCWEVVKVGGWT